MFNTRYNRILANAGGLLLATLILSGCVTPLSGPPAASLPPTVTPVPGQLTVDDVMARPAPLAGGNGAIYFVVRNGLDQDVQLLSVSSPAADAVELHETVEENGVMRMIPHPEGFPVPTGGAVELKPGGKHVMLIGLAQPLNTGDTVDLLLSFDNGDTIALTAPVAEMGGDMPDMTDMGMHDHGDTASAASHDHAAMEAHDHGDTASTASHDHATPETATAPASHDHGAAMTEDVATLIAALPISEIHALDEILGAGGRDAEAETVVAMLVEAIDNAVWPESFQPQIVEIRQAAVALQAALADDDLATAATLAAPLHDALHDLEHATAHQH